jgi:hypothetical protein
MQNEKRERGEKGARRTQTENGRSSKKRQEHKYKEKQARGYLPQTTEE